MPTNRDTESADVCCPVRFVRAAKLPVVTACGRRCQTRGPRTNLTRRGNWKHAHTLDFEPHAVVSDRGCRALPCVR